MDNNTKYRSAIGVDFHPLTMNKKLTLGGIEIPYTKGLDGHSDGDALTHAIIDSILGIAALGDIGTFFPDSKPEYHLKYSIDLLSEAINMVNNKGWYLTFLDATIIAESPKMTNHLKNMKKILSSRFKLEIDDISIKATSTNGLGFVGKEKGIGAIAISTAKIEM